MEVKSSDFHYLKVTDVIPPRLVAKKAYSRCTDEAPGISELASRRM
jgi:hypothetical protein